MERMNFPISFDYLIKWLQELPDFIVNCGWNSFPGCFRRVWSTHSTRVKQFVWWLLKPNRIFGGLSWLTALGRFRSNVFSNKIYVVSWATFVRLEGAFRGVDTKNVTNWFWMEFHCRPCEFSSEIGAHLVTKSSFSLVKVVIASCYHSNTKDFRTLLSYIRIAVLDIMTSFSRFTEFLNSQYYRNAGVGIGRKHLWWKIPLVISPFLFPDPIEWFPDKKVENEIPRETVEWVHNELSSIPGMPMDEIELVQWKGGLFYGSSASPAIWRYFGHDKKKYHLWIPSKLDQRILNNDPHRPLEISVGGPTKLFLPPTPSDSLLIDRFALAHEAGAISIVLTEYNLAFSAYSGTRFNERKLVFSHRVGICACWTFECNEIHCENRSHICWPEVVCKISRKQSRQDRSQVT